MGTFPISQLPRSSGMSRNTCILGAITQSCFKILLPQDRARDEINRVFPADEYYNISTEDLGKLKYLEMIMKESLRLYPSSPYLSRRIPQDMKIGELEEGIS